MKSKASWLAKVALTLCICAALACVSPACAESNPAEQYYNAGSLPLFEIAFSRMDVSDQEAWLEKLYADGSTAFFSAAVRKIDADSSRPADLAEHAYADGKIAMFSILMDCMGQAELESWLDRALEDEKWGFQSILFDQLARGDEFDALEAEREKAWAAAQAEAYQAVGVTMDGKDYFYEEQLVNVFLDIRAGGSYCTLNTNPAGTVNIQIVRDADDKITGVSTMTEAEVAALFQDTRTPDDP